MAQGDMGRRAFLGTMLGVAVAPAAGAGTAVSQPKEVASACVRAVPASELGVAPHPMLDQSEAFLRALERAAALNLPLQLPPGDVVVGDVHVSFPVRLVGAPQARLVCRPGARRMMHFSGPLAHLEGVRCFGRAQRRFSRREDPEGLLSFAGVRDVRVRHCEVDGAGGHGLALERCRGVIEHNKVGDVAEAALFSLDGQALQVVRNTIAKCGNGGILIWQSQKRSDKSLVAMNRIRHVRADAGGNGQNGNGINVFRAGGVRVVDNDIADCAFSAVRNNSGDEVVIARNLCRRSGEVAIFVEFAFFKALVASNLVEGAAAGISVTNMREGGRSATVTGNIVRDVAPVRGNEGEEGYGIAAEADTTITGNVVERAAKFGLALGWGPYLRNVTASGNVVRETPVGAAVSVVKGAGMAVLTANVFERIRYAVAGYDHTRRITGDLLMAEKRPRNVTLNANVVKRG